MSSLFGLLVLALTCVLPAFLRLAITLWRIPRQEWREMHEAEKVAKRVAHAYRKFGKGEKFTEEDNAAFAAAHSYMRRGVLEPIPGGVGYRLSKLYWDEVTSRQATRRWT